MAVGGVAGLNTVSAYSHYLPAAFEKVLGFVTVMAVCHEAIVLCGTRRADMFR